MRYLVVGDGAREDAIFQMLCRGHVAEKISALKNGGISQYAQMPIPREDIPRQ